MTEVTATATDVADEEIALVVQQPGEQQAEVFKFLSLMLSYLYGFNIKAVGSIAEASPLLMDRAKQVRCVFVVHNEKITSTMSLTALSLRGSIPVFRTSNRQWELFGVYSLAAFGFAEGSTGHQLSFGFKHYW